jgi:hypothetical protein
VLRGLVAPARSLVHLSVAGGRGRVVIIPQEPAGSAASAASNGEIEVTVYDSVALGWSGVQSRRLVLEHPKPIHLLTGNTPVQLEFALSEQDEVRFERVRLSAVEFLRREDTPSGAGVPAESVSSIIGGTVRFDAVADREYTFRRGDSLEAAIGQRAAAGFQFNRDNVRVDLSASVRSLRGGPPEYDVDLMPSKLEDYHARLGLRLVAITALGILPWLAKAVQWVFAKRECE